MARTPQTKRSSRIPTPRMSHWQPNPLNYQTLENMEARGYKVDEARSTGAMSYIHDMSSPSYRWLLPGWIAEERQLPHGRVYKYYYDPAGRQYRNKFEVIDQWENVGVVVLDP